MNPHTQCPDINFVCPGTAYLKDRLGNQVNDLFLSIHTTNCIDDFLDRALHEICGKTYKAIKRDRSDNVFSQGGECFDGWTDSLGELVSSKGY